MTEIPANTPKPMGSTLRFLPGRAKSCELSVDSAAAADPAPPLLLVLSDAAPEVPVAAAFEADELVALVLPDDDAPPVELALL